MNRLQPATYGSGHAAQRTAFAAALVAGIVLVWQSTLVWPGTVAAVDGATPSPPIEAAQTPTPDPAPNPEPTDPVPSMTAEPTQAPPTAEPSVEPTPGPNPDPSPSPSGGNGPLAVVHYTFARVAGPDTAPAYLAPDTPLVEEPRFDVLRLRLDVANSSDSDITFTPLLEFALATDGVFAALAEGIQTDVAFRAANEWIASPGGGTVIGPTLVIEPEGSANPDVARSMGVNPMPPLTIRALGSMTIEFSVSATVAAAYDTEYAFRLTDGGSPLVAAGMPVVRMETQPPLELTPGQRNGAPPDSDAPPLKPNVPLGPSSTSVHTAAYDLSGDFCASCHRAHRAPGVGLIAAPTQLTLCSSCHNGTDLPSIAAEYDSIPANDASARAWYQHDPTIEQGTLGTANACVDCHNPHDITDTAAAQTASGWTPSGQTYGATDSSGQRIGLEYQLCFKCHASPATLPSNDGQPPSRYALDKALELDPSVGSYHPIEAAGSNDTPAMAGSLAGSSPYKLWAVNFAPDSTVRCVNCHADRRLADAVLDDLPRTYLSADSTLQVHASSERGILIQPYQDRVLNGPGDSNQASDFALCYTCHAEAPFVDATGNERGLAGSPLDSNFRYHGFHLSDALQDYGTGPLDIDTPGGGQGPAICAECHFRIHSTAFAVGSQTNNSRLVNFAPDVTALSTGEFDWQPRTYDVDGNLLTAGSCTLKCHGVPHKDGVPY